MKGGSKIGHIGPVMRMHKRGRSAGFTIVETLIVLAVMGTIMMIAILAMEGKTRQTQFLQAINEVQSHIQQTINDTANGYYPNAKNFTCNRAGASVSISVGTTSQGENRDCTFIGKILQFKVQGTDPEEYVTYPVVGLRCATAGGGICASPSLAASAPVALYPDGTYVAPGIDGSVTTSLQNGLTTHAITYNGGLPTGAIGFIADPTTLAQSASGQAAGSQATGLYAVNTSVLGETREQTVAKIDTAGNLVQATGGVQICFASGTTDQSGLVIIGGGQGQPTSVTLKHFDGNTTCS